ncbi:MAG: ASPIC/UnbV domain-containing protein, partial [Thermoanaerobaculia bacterium]|nr:ASPIC/UnbV domain-containing protein [Thermoanaerobaculia bacterium]
LVVSHLDRETNTLYLNLGPAGFADASGDSAAGPPSYPHTGFGAVLFDLELDGDLDLFVANGRVRRGEAALPGGPPPGQPLAEYAQPNLLLVNDGGGRFADRSQAAGELATRAEVSRAVMVGDLDHDGDLDALLTQCDGPARLFRNDAPRAGRWVAARVLDRPGGTAVEGARVTAEAGGVLRLALQTSGRGYLSSAPVPAHLGLGRVERVERLAVRWPDGRRAELRDLPPDRVYEIAARRLR